ncbi:hypothetical protein A2954_04350 [Candidatus Roizmanbacteria bacterium RIFCSPLOWO2_01_FULL_37_12]|uniref:Glycosyltransferase 2-like domain-containing protein n=1 Tax=Candidatus Roizmanbacteria bacterium RIFCSPLOWO2_01_FULL_37_12 TaxID=1802056 RepID=A0A1F7IFT2_9BACT|nr:MAG: hypothetical protein A3D76_06260 [Candidatus Roizmanbacteria bacterium RIFCSPHIGHO2_02_FULL_37_9b]OGK42215.1 MAG: hypothetical protein A2954_04350 [Candidatus Roizmanbacteria bacterium RIFCSPLOWO2_01_FULL_37_12]
MSKEKIIAIIPCFNNANTIKAVCKSISKKYVNEIIVIDDGSTDQTLSVLKKIGVSYISHKRNLGYGASQKSGYKVALKKGADLIIMLHSDGQHDPKYIPLLIKTLKEKKLDIVMGSRIKSISYALKNKMPLYKIIFNKILTQITNIILGLQLTEYHTGYRVFKRKVLENQNINKLSDEFIFDQEILLSAHLHNYRIGDVLTSCIYNADSNSINFRKSLRYGFAVVGSLLRYVFNKNYYF